MGSACIGRRCLAIWVGLWSGRSASKRMPNRVEISLFGGTAEPANAIVRVGYPLERCRTVSAQKEALGFYISSHPLTAVQPQLQRLVTANSQNLAEQPGGEVKVGGVITQLRTQLTKKGDRMAFLTLEDLYGTIEVIVFPETYRQSITYCESEEPLLIWGTVEGASDDRIIACAYRRPAASSCPRWTPRAGYYM